MKGNPALRKVSQYWRNMISSLPNLYFLDDRPVFELDRLGAEAWKRGGPEEER